MIKARIWYILMPALAIGVATAWVVGKLPSTYKSTALLAMKAPKISDKVVEPLTEEDTARRLHALTQNILSRSNLEQLIARHNLYEKERGSGKKLDGLIDNVRKNITVDVEKDGEDKIMGFRITYVDTNPSSARAMTDALADLYVSRQIDESVAMVETTSEFIDKQLSQAKGTLDELERQRIKIMMENADTLPESSQGLIAQLDGLRKREESIGKEKEVLSAERGRLNDQIASNNRQASLVEDYGLSETQDAARQASQIEDTPAYAQLVNKRAELTGQLDKLLTVYKEKHPDVATKRNEIARVNEEIENLRKTTEKRLKAVNQTSSRKVDLQKKTLELENQRLQGQIAQIDRQLGYKDQELLQNTEKIGVLEEKINRIPDIRIALEGITARYESAKTVYDDLYKKFSSSQGQVTRESNSQGETIQVVDRANLPTAPTNVTKKIFLALAGIGFGFGFGLFVVALVEVPRLFKIQNAEDMKYFAGFSTTFVVPSLLTDREIRRKNLLRRTGWVLALVLTIVSVPALILVLQRSQLLERFI